MRWICQTVKKCRKDLLAELKRTKAGLVKNLPTPKS
jgi:hypothetical protein